MFVDTLCLTQSAFILYVKQGTNVAHNVTGRLLIDLTSVAIALLLPCQCHSISLTITQWNVGAVSFRTVFAADKVVPLTSIDLCKIKLHIFYDLAMR